MPSISVPRPHGPLNWILQKLPNVVPWTAVGCLSAEDRCSSAIRQLLETDSSARAYILKLMPHRMSEDADQISERVSRHETEMTRDFGNRIHIESGKPLHSMSHDILESVRTIADRMAGAVLIDISTMPKRWFFPLIKEMLSSARVTDLVVTNSKAQRYGDWLAKDADQWEPLPGYLHLDHDTPTATAIVGVGYHSLNIHELVGESRSFAVTLKLMMPFPSSHPGFRKNWEFALSVKKERNQQLSPEIVRVPTDDVSIAFDRLVQHTESGTVGSLILAPYGPKPLSLAMCLLEIARENRSSSLQTEIGYTQPKSYSAEYSSGVLRSDEANPINAYCIRLSRRDLYRLQ